MVEADSEIGNLIAESSSCPGVTGMAYWPLFAGSASSLSFDKEWYHHTQGSCAWHTNPYLWAVHHICFSALWSELYNLLGLVLSCWDLMTW
jgi:hypothetical protein